MADETGVIRLPSIEDGVLAIGDLWDSRSSKRVGFNLFGNKLRTKFVGVDPGVSSAKSELSVVKTTGDSLFKLGFSASASVSLLNGLIKLGEAGFDFEMEESDSFSSEKLEWMADQKTVKLALKFDTGESPDFQESIDGHVLKLLQSGKLKATHIVKEVDLGAHGQGTVTITQTNSNNSYKVGFWASKEISYLVMKVDFKISVEVSDTVKKSNYEIKITSASVPPLQPPTEMVEFLQLGNKMFEQMETETHFPPEWMDGAGKLVRGVPRVFVLVPLSRYLDLRLSNAPFIGPEEKLLKDLVAVLSEIRDFQTPNILKQTILRKRPELLKILSNPDHVVTKEISGAEEALQKDILSEKTDINKKFIQLNSENEPEWSELQKLVDEFNQMKFQEKIDHLVEEYKEKGEDEILTITIKENELTEKSPLQFFTDSESLESWLKTDATIKILYRTHFGMVSEGIQLRLYNMAVALGRFGAESGIAYPSLTSEGVTNIVDGSQPPLTIKTSKKLTEFDSKDGEALLAISVLEASIGRSSSSARVFGVYAELLGITLPMTSKQLENAIPLIDFLREKTNGVRIHESQITTMAAMQDRTEMFKYFVTGDVVQSLTDNIPCIQLLRDTGLKDSELHVGTFGLRSNISGAPNVFVCHSGKLHAICLDHLDVIILLAIERDLISDTSVLRPKLVAKNCLSPSRLEFAETIATYFPDSTDDAETSSTVDQFPTNPCEDIQNALDVAISFLADQTKTPLALASSLANILIRMSTEVGERINGIPGWDSSKNEFIIEVGYVDGWLKIKHQMEFFLYKEEPFLGILNNVISKLEVFCGAEEELIELQPVDPDPEPDPDDRVKVRSPSNEDEDQDVREGLVELIHEVTDDLDCPEHLNTKMVWAEENTQHPQVLARIALKFFKIEAQKILQEKPVYFHLNNLMRVAEEVSESEGVSRWTQEDLHAEYLSRVEEKLDQPKYPGAIGEIKRALSRQTYYSLVKTLAACHENSELYLIHKEFEEFNGLTDWRGIVRLLEHMEKDEFNETSLAYIWGNPKFVYLMESNKSNRAVLEAIVEFQCKDGVPSFIPSPIRELLEVVYEEGSRGKYDWVQYWRDTEDVLDALETISVRNAIPVEFPATLLRNMLRDENIRSNLAEAGALVYWDDEEKYFTEPWDLSTIERVVEMIMALDTVKGQSVENTINTSVMLTMVGGKGQTELHPKNKDDDRQHGGSPDNQLSTTLTREAYLSIKDVDEEWSQEDSVTMMAEILKRNGPPIKAMNSGNTHKFGRVDKTTLLMNKVEPLVLAQLLTRWNNFSTSLPLIVQTVSENPKDTEDYRCLLPLLQGLPLKGEMSDGLFQHGSRFKFILALRIGHNPNCGKSSVLNQLWMKDNNCFSSILDTGRPIGSSKHLYGMVEVIQLCAQTCDDNVIGDNPGEVLLANLHGDALEGDQPEILKFLAKMASAFVVFWMPQSWVKLQENRRHLESLLGSLHNVFDVCLDAQEDVVKMVNQDLLISSPILGDDMGSNFEKMAKMLFLALKCKAGPFDSNVLNHGPIVMVNKYDLHPEVKLLFDLTKNPVTVRRLLCLQMEDANTVQQIEELFETNLGYVELIRQFCAVLSLPSHKLEGALAEINKSFGQRSALAIELLRNHLRALSDKLSTMELSTGEMSFLRPDMKRARIQLTNSRLEFHHFLNELGRIWSLIPNKLSEYLSEPFPAIAANLIQRSRKFQVPTSSEGFFTDIWFEDALACIEKTHPGLRIFVISVFGPEGSQTKTALINSLFGVIDQDGVLLTTSDGLKMQLLFLDEEFKNLIGLDALLLLDSQGICRPEELGLGTPNVQNELDRKFAALLLAMSDLSIVIGTEALVPALEVALLTNIRLSNTTTPNILITGDLDDPDIWITRLTEMMDNIKIITDSYTHESGIKDLNNNKFFKIYRAIEFGDIVSNIRLGTVNSAFEHEDVISIYQQILSSMRQHGSTKMSLTTWVNSLKATWSKIQFPTFPSNFLNTVDVGVALSLKVRLEALNDKIDASFGHHCAENEIFIYDQMSQISRGEPSGPSDEEFDLSPESIMRNIAIEIDGKVLPIFRSCKFEDGVSCTLCNAALKAEEDLIKAFPEEADKIDDGINEYIRMSRDGVWRVTQQLMTAFLVKLEFKELAPNLIKTLKGLAAEKNQPIIDKEIWLNFKQQISTKLLVIPSKRRIKVEVLQTYPNIVVNPTQSADFVRRQMAFRTRSSFGQGQENKYLTWKEASWLINKIEGMLPSILLERNAARIFENGMIRELKGKVEVILDELEGKVKKLIPAFRIKCHEFAIGRFTEVLNSKEDEWNEDNHPIRILDANQDVYFKKLGTIVAGA